MYILTPSSKYCLKKASDSYNMKKLTDQGTR